MNLAIIGSNNMGCLHARMAANCGLKIAVCGDKIKEIAQTLADQHGADATDDCFAAIRRPDVDIVGIMTPTPTHLDYILAAVEAKKDIFCEKPLARTVEQCKQVLAAVKKAKVRLVVGHVVRYFPEYEAIRGQIAADKVGKVGFVKMYRGGMFPGGNRGWFSNYEMSGGVTFDSMIHDFDWLRYVFGEPERVFCQALRRSQPQPLDYSMATLRMKNGILAQVIGTWAHPSGFRTEVEICGEKGMIQFNSDEVSFSVMKRAEPGEGPRVIVPGAPVPVSPYQLEWQDFLTCIEGKSRARVSPEDALEAVRISSAALKSAETGKPVRL